MSSRPKSTAVTIINKINEPQFAVQQSDAIPTPDERRGIGWRALVDERTILRVYRGQPVRQASVLRVQRAAAELGIRLPRRSTQG